MSIRKAENIDTRRVAEIQLASSAAAYKDIFPKREITEALIGQRGKIWIEILKEELTSLDIYEDDEDIKGFINYGPTRDTDKTHNITVEILAMYIDPKYWRSGIGTKLLENVFNWAKNEAFQEITLWVLKQNIIGISFYNKMGFNEDGTTKIHSQGIIVQRMNLNIALDPTKNDNSIN